MLVRCLFLMVFVAAVSAADVASVYRQAEEAQRAGNWADAFGLYEKVVLELDAADKHLAPALRGAADCLHRLQRDKELDALLEAAVVRHPASFELLRAAAQRYEQAQHWGFIISGQFERGHHRGGGKQASAQDRDRARALQLMQQAAALEGQHPSSFWLAYAQLWRSGQALWRLQALTDVSVLPDYEETPYWGYSGNAGAQGAPVDAKGEPVLYRVPASFEQAQSDGERWRWCLMQAAEAGDKGGALWQRYEHARASFAVETMNRHGFVLPPPDDSEDGKLGPWAVHTLDDSEVLAQLATGARRFQLGPEFHHIALLQELVSQPAYQNRARRTLAQVFENRRQYPRAAELWTLAGKHEQAAQITGNWGRFDPGATQPAGTKTRLNYVFRNGTDLRLQAWRIDVDGLLQHVRRSLIGRKGPVDWNELQIERLGHRIITEGDRRFVGERVAQWQQVLKPLPDHFDRRVEIETPLEQAGAYLVEATLIGGSTSRMVVWIADTALVRKDVDGQAWYYVADAVTGKPVADAQVDWFGFDVRTEGRKRFVVHQEHSQRSGADGIVRLPAASVPNDYQWMVTARGADGRLAFLGFQHHWFNSWQHSSYQQTRGYVITDRPVYRPGDTVHLSGWLREARYDLDDREGAVAGRPVTLQVNNGKGEKVLEHTLTTDPYGGFQYDWIAPADAVLGSYGVTILHFDAHRSFRVEEYKKPEFEVSVEAPNEPIALGDAFTATIEARYLFGAPVSDGEVHYTVTRSDRTQVWYPPMAWDWLYGAGYWWFCGEYPWYPGWRVWGCIAPRPAWIPWNQPPPEVVAEGTMPIGVDGTLAVPIDTALAKATMGDRDHEYRISVEVTDRSRRTIAGSGSVVAARAPFAVTVWTAEGWHPRGEAITLEAAATTVDGKPVAASGTARLLHISFDADRKPLETEVAQAEVHTDVEGRLRHRFLADKAGQYRLEVTLKDAKDRAITGASIVTVTGAGGEGDFRFNALELIPDKTDYAPGDVARVLLAVDRADAQVLLFLRPENGTYREPQVIMMEGRTRLIDIP
ncbi:MAG: MG2 domain-containing protein, partial [Planctomycetota bacterium]|nr:MG2 domain-containing protein [Planctomycetota bacterium]